MNNIPAFSIIIPAYNEAAIISQVLDSLKRELTSKPLPSGYEIIVVDDGSSDGTYEKLLQVQGIKLIKHKRNRGYGAAIKTAVAHAQYDWVLWYDSDGQHTPNHVWTLLENLNDENMVVGARIKYRSPVLRKPGKWLITKLANYLVGQKIPDLNSGMRLVRKNDFIKFQHLYPDGFSISTTITLSFLKSKLSVHYVPIDVPHRVGKSSVKLEDAFKTIALIFRIITLFSPLRVFGPLTVILAMATAVSVSIDIVSRNLADTSLILFLSTMIMFSFGILLDHVAAIRRELHN